MRILFISGGYKEKNHFVKLAFKDMQDVDLVETYRWVEEVSYYNDRRSFIEKVFEKLRIPLDFSHSNRRILEKLNEYDFDIIFVIKGNHIYPSTIRKIKSIQPTSILINWSLDDMFAKHNRSVFYSKNLPLFDLVITTKSYNCLPDELPSLGAKKILFQNNSFYNYSFFQDLQRPNSFLYDICFVGTAELQRFHSLNFLAKHGYKVKIFGSSWDKKIYRNHEDNLSIEYRNLDQREYFETIINSKISLCFLRKLNRDLQTLRTVEIPSVGGFMLAERTLEHTSMFVEDDEAVFFGDDNELLQKVKKYLTDDQIREKIAKKGMLKSHAKFQLRKRLREIINMSISLKD